MVHVTMAWDWSRRIARVCGLLPGDCWSLCGARDCGCVPICAHGIASGKHTQESVVFTRSRVSSISCGDGCDGDGYVSMQIWNAKEVNVKLLFVVACPVRT